MSRPAAKTLAERQPGQMVQVPQRPGEPLLAYLIRALSANQALLLGDMMRGEYR